MGQPCYFVRLYDAVVTMLAAEGKEDRIVWQKFSQRASTCAVSSTWTCLRGRTFYEKTQDVCIERLLVSLLPSSRLSSSNTHSYTNLASAFLFLLQLSTRGCAQFASHVRLTQTHRDHEAKARGQVLGLVTMGHCTSCTSHHHKIERTHTLCTIVFNVNQV